ncbi:MAG TPA: serine/threonine-protein kinase [Labilithrix sp.]|jgi:serine/threonine-protein kinase
MEASNARLRIPPGTVVAGKYRVGRVIGSGGMGCVLEATHLSLLQRVAIKVVLDDGADAEVRARFLREARAAVALTSEHVARVLDVGELDSGGPYIVMEYLDGVTLEDRFAQGPMSVGEVVEIVTQACDALSEAHARGIVHRDVKPANLFLVKKARGQTFVKVLDFGISRVADPRLAVQEGLTGTAAILGTPHYMAPEQMTASRDVDARADVWALGVCIYRALAGRYPFDATTLMELGAQVLATDPRPIVSHRPDIPPALAAIVARCMRRDPRERFATAAELGNAIEAMPGGHTRVLGNQTPSVAPPAPAQTAPLPQPPAIPTAMALGGMKPAPSGKGSTSTLVVVGLLGLAVLATMAFGYRSAARRAAQAREAPPVEATAIGTATAASTSTATATAIATVDPAPARSAAAATESAAPSALAPTAAPRAGRTRTAPRVASPPPAASSRPTPAATPTRPATDSPDER